MSFKQQFEWRLQGTWCICIRLLKHALPCNASYATPRCFADLDCSVVLVLVLWADMNIMKDHWLFSSAWSLVALCEHNMAQWTWAFFFVCVWTWQDDMATADVAALTRLLERQMQAAEEREKRLQDMLTATLGSLPKQSSNPQTTTSSTRQVSAERPILISSATQADFTAWEDVARIDRQSHTFEWGDGPMQCIVREGKHKTSKIAFLFTEKKFASTFYTLHTSLTTL